MTADTTCNTITRSHGHIKQPKMLSRRQTLVSRRVESPNAFGSRTPPIPTGGGLQRSPRPPSHRKGRRREETALMNSWLPPCIAATFPTLLALPLHPWLHAEQRLCNGRLSRRSTAAAAACGWFAAERAARAADIDRYLARSVANAGSVMS